MNKLLSYLRYGYLLAMIFLLACTSSKNKNTKLPKLSGYFKYSEGKEVLISAHRGGKGYSGYPENCLETMEYIRKRIPKAIYEVDVAQTKDSVLVLMHDNSVSRTTTSHGNVRDLCWEEVKGCKLIDDAGDTTGFHVPLFTKVLRWADSLGVILMVDIKKTVKPRTVIGYIKKYSAEDNVVIITYSLKSAKEIYSLAPQLMLSVSIRNVEELKSAANSGVPFGNMVAFTGVRESDSSLYEAIHRKGRMCILGTLGNIDRKAASRLGGKGKGVYSGLAQKGVDIFATDRPLEAYQAVKGIN